VIHQLDLSGCTQLHLGVIGLSRNIVSNNVKVIKMCNLNVSDSMLGWIASGCKNLQKIDLSGCSFVHTSSLGYLFNGCKRYDYVNIFSWMQFSASEKCICEYQIEIIVFE